VNDRGKMDGLKRPRDEGGGGGREGGERMVDGDGEELVTMMDVFNQQKELEEEAMCKEKEEWGDESRCTAELVCFSLLEC